MQHVFLMRHGERLDSMDRNWRRTAARPYDTPLTRRGHSEANRLVKQRLEGKVSVIDASGLAIVRGRIKLSLPS